MGLKCGGNHEWWGFLVDIEAPVGIRAVCFALKSWPLALSEHVVGWRESPALLEGGPKLIVLLLQLGNDSLDGGDKRLLAIPSHLCMQSVPLTPEVIVVCRRIRCVGDVSEMLKIYILKN